MLDYPYKVQRGDNLTRIGKKFGYTNPGPIAAYPGNEAYFKRRDRSVNRIMPGDLFDVPWHPDHIDKLIATSRELIKQTSISANALIREQIKDKEELEKFLIKIDAINFLASIGVNVTSLAINGAKGATMSSKQALSWLINDKVKMAGDVMSTFVVQAPQAPKKDFSFYVRHALGPWNPSYWASVATAIKTGDLDTYLYGAGATAYKNCRKISEQANRDISKLRVKILKYQLQKSMSFYQKRI